MVDFWSKKCNISFNFIIVWFIDLLKIPKYLVNIIIPTVCLVWLAVQPLTDILLKEWKHELDSKEPSGGSLENWLTFISVCEDVLGSEHGSPRVFSTFQELNVCDWCDLADRKRKTQRIRRYSWRVTGIDGKQDKITVARDLDT